MHYATNGSCYGEYRHKIPEGHVECAPRPSDVHVISDNWKDAPMDPNVCWRPKTQLEFNAECDEAANSRWREDPQNDKLMALLYNISERLRVLENKPPQDKQTFWGQLTKFLQNNKFFDF